MKVIVTVDGSDCAALAVDAIVEHVWHENDEFLVLSVAEPLPKEFSFLRDGTSDETEQSLVHQYEIFVESAAKRIREAHPENTVTERVSNGPVAATIVNVASDWKADLIVMASHGRKGFQRIFVGSVSYDVIKLANCSVEVIKKH